MTEINKLLKDVIAENISDKQEATFILSVREILFKEIPLENKMKFYNWLTEKYFKAFGYEIPGDENRILRRKAFNRRLARKRIALKIRTYHGRLVLVPRDYEFPVTRKSWK